MHAAHRPHTTTIAPSVCWRCHAARMCSPACISGSSSPSCNCGDGCVRACMAMHGHACMQAGLQRGRPMCCCDCQCVCRCRHAHPTLLAHHTRSAPCRPAAERQRQHQGRGARAAAQRHRAGQAQRERAAGAHQRHAQGGGAGARGQQHAARLCVPRVPGPRGDAGGGAGAVRHPAAARRRAAGLQRHHLRVRPDRCEGARTPAPARVHAITRVWREGGRRGGRGALTSTHPLTRTPAHGRLAVADFEKPRARMHGCTHARTHTCTHLWQPEAAC